MKLVRHVHYHIKFRPDIKSLEDAVIFHAGTTVSGDNIVTAGGRVLAVTAYGHTLQEAVSRAYETADQIQFGGKTYRKDIAHRFRNLLSFSRQFLTIF